MHLQAIGSYLFGILKNDARLFIFYLLFFKNKKKKKDWVGTTLRLPPSLSNCDTDGKS